MQEPDERNEHVSEDRKIDQAISDELDTPETTPESELEEINAALAHQGIVDLAPEEGFDPTNQFGNYIEYQYEDATIVVADAQGRNTTAQKNHAQTLMYENAAASIPAKYITRVVFTHVETEDSAGRPRYFTAWLYPGCESAPEKQILKTHNFLSKWVTEHFAREDEEREVRRKTDKKLRKAARKAVENKQNKKKKGGV